MRNYEYHTHWPWQTNLETSTVINAIQTTSTRTNTLIFVYAFLQMQEDLRRLVRSGVYLMLLVDFCKDTFQDLLQDRDAIARQSNTIPVDIHPPTAISALAEHRIDRRHPATRVITRAEGIVLLCC